MHPGDLLNGVNSKRQPKSSISCICGRKRRMSEMFDLAANAGVNWKFDDFARKNTSTNVATTSISPAAKLVNPQCIL